MRGRTIIGLLILLLFSGIAEGQRSFNDLRGVTDSLGYTTLFYRTLNVSWPGFVWSNNIYRMNLPSSETVRVREEYHNSGTGHTFNDLRVLDYEFADNNANSPVIGENYSYFSSGYYGVSSRILMDTTYVYQVSQPGGHNIEIARDNPHTMYATNNDQHNTVSALLVSTDNGWNWSSTDRVFQMISLNRHIPGELFGRNSNFNLLLSSDTGATSSIVDSIFTWKDYTRFLYDNDGNHIYAPTSVGTTKHAVVSSDRGLHWVSFLSDTGSIWLAIDEAVAGRVYTSFQREVRVSNDFAVHFSIYHTFSENVVGLYKKPGTDTLYVMTPTYIYETTTASQRIINDVTDVREYLNQISIPIHPTLFQCYPNPFNPTTTISFTIPSSQMVELKVYDMLGREVAELINEYKQAGSYSAQFNASHLASGIYFYKLKAGNFVQTKKLILLK